MISFGFRKISTDHGLRHSKKWSLGFHKINLTNGWILRFVYFHGKEYIYYFTATYDNNKYITLEV